MSSYTQSEFERVLSELQCVLLARRAANDDGTMNLAWIDFDILDYLQRKGAFTPSDLCTIFNLTKSNMSKHLKRLKEYGLIEYTQNEKDGRSFFVSISAEGIELMTNVHQGHHEMAVQAGHVLSAAEKQQFAAIAKKITDALDDPELHMI